MLGAANTSPDSTSPHSSTSPRAIRWRRLLLPLTAVIAFTGLATPANAIFTDHETVGENTFATVTVAPPTDLHLTELDGAYQLSWTPSATARVDGYQVHRSVDGDPFTLVATLTGRSVTTFVDHLAPGGEMAPEDAHRYRVAATLSTWTSGQSSVAGSEGSGVSHR